MTKRTGILIAVIAALVAGGLAIGLGLMSNSHATEPTTAAHTGHNHPHHDGANGPTVDYRPADYRAAPAPAPAPPAPATPAADNGPPSGATASSCQRYCSGQWRRS